VEKCKALCQFTGVVDQKLSLAERALLCAGSVLVVLLHFAGKALISN